MENDRGSFRLILPSEEHKNSPDLNKNPTLTLAELNNQFYDQIKQKQVDDLKNILLVMQ